MIRPGEIYMADFAEAGPHPVIASSERWLPLPFSIASRGERSPNTNGTTVRAVDRF